MSISSMSHGDFKKWPCRPVNLRGLGPFTGTYFPMVDSTVSNYGPRPLKLTGRHGHFLNLTCDIGPSDMRQGLKIVVTWDITFS